MADSNITCAALAATVSPGQVKLTWTVTDPNAQGLPYLQFKSAEVYASATNNRGSAVKVGEGLTDFVHNAGEGVTRYYWVRPINQSGSFGDWFPLSATAGVVATAGSATPGPNSIGTAQLQAGAVTYDKVDYILASQVSAASLDAITATLGTVYSGYILSSTFEGGVFQTAASGRRVLISGANNDLRVYDASGAEIGRFGYSSSAAVVLNISHSSTTPTASITNAGAGSAVTAANTGTGAAISGTASGVGFLSYGGAFSNSGGSGGNGRAGLSSALGGYAFYAVTGGYGPFTGQHDALLAKGVECLPGWVVCDIEVIARDGIDDTLTEVAPCARVGDKRVVGVVSRIAPFDPMAMIAGLPNIDSEDEVTDERRHIAETYMRLTINSVGEGQMLVCGRGGGIAAGDLIMASDLLGHGMRQPDDLMRSCTVAKARESVTFANPDDARLISCIYTCG